MSQRNAPCHCGSSKKYKKCCLHADESASALKATVVLLEDATNGLLPAFGYIRREAAPYASPELPGMVTYTKSAKALREMRGEPLHPDYFLIDPDDASEEAPKAVPPIMVELAGGIVSSLVKG